MSDQNIYFRESVSTKSVKPVLAKSPNKLNRLVFTAEPLKGEVIEAIERKEISPFINKEYLVKLLVNLGWDTNDAENVWGFGPS